MARLPDRGAGKVVAENVRGRGSRAQPCERAGLAEADAVAESLSRELEPVACLPDREQRALQRAHAERARDDFSEDLAPDDERPRAAEHDELGATCRVAACDLDAVQR